MPATAAVMLPPVVVFSRLPDEMFDIAKDVVVALVPVALAKTKGPVRVVEAEVRPPLKSMSVVVALLGNG